MSDPDSLGRWLTLGRNNYAAARLQGLEADLNLTDTQCKGFYELDLVMQLTRRNRPDWAFGALHHLRKCRPFPTDFIMTELCL